MDKIIDKIIKKLICFFKGHERNFFKRGGGLQCLRCKKIFKNY